MNERAWGFGTLAIHAGQQPDPSTGAVMTPIYATSTYVQESPGVHRGFEYSRSHNPTRFAYERCVAALEGGSRGFAFASGLAATSTILELLDSGSHVVAMDDVYGGTYRLFERVRRRSAGLDFSWVDLSDLAAFEAAIRPNTRMVWIETPTNPTLKLVDIAAVAERAKKRGLIVVVDNTFCSPALQRPIELGADIVMHSATKYINGHSDIVGGLAVVGDRTDLAEQMAFLQNAVGGVQGALRQLLGAARPQDPAPAHESPLRERAGHRRVPRAPPGGGARGLPPASRHTRSTPLAQRQMKRPGRHGERLAERGLRGSEALHGAHRAIRLRRELRGRGEPCQPPGGDDPRQRAARAPCRARYRRQPRALECGGGGYG
ncbi:MAG: hypothetical protein KatS3mg082_2782 [Nitrospiraceae bacterium]|nr:MAG: hypothetical protein KatS3mg082_2782 [Nitrospiraceae bacterium]